MPTNVPPATTVAPSRRSARSARASASEAGASHSGSVDNRDGLLVQRLRELTRTGDTDPLVHPAELRLRPVATAAARREPAHDDRRVHLQERERVGGLNEVLVRCAAGLVRDDQ